MIGSDLEGADLESRVASWAASATSDDAAAVRAVIEAYGDRLAAADVAGVVSQYTGNVAVMQPGLETVEGSRQFTPAYDPAFENMRLDFTFRFDDITVKGDLAAGQGNRSGDDHDPRYRRDATSASPAAVRSGTHGGHWKITQYMYKQMPEQSGGGCSGI
jgi:ketosteroid isomerase-like protein